MEETNIQWHLGVKPAVDLELAAERANLSYLQGKLSDGTGIYISQST